MSPNADVPATQEWNKIFPTNVTKNYLQSVKFIKQLTAVVVSKIVYLRDAFYMDSYFEKIFYGLRLKILKIKCRDQLAQFLSTFMDRAFEALDKKYLQQLAICFYEEECKAENLFEYYIFDYSYESDGLTMNVRSKKESACTEQYTFDDVHSATIELLKSFMVVLESYTEKLPSSYYLALRVQYNEDAPEGYQVPGFASSDDDHLEGLKATLKLGHVNTPFHGMRARCYKAETVHSYDATPSENPPTMSQIQEYDKAGYDPKMMEKARLQCECMKHKIKCNDDCKEMLLTCSYCNMQQHAVCLGVLPEDAQHVKKHCCASCYVENANRTLTDQMTILADNNMRKSLLILRRALYYCMRHKEITTQVIELFGTSKESAHETMDKLKKLGIIENMKPGSMLPSKINLNNLSKQLRNFFNRIEREGIVRRLLAEMTAYKNPQNDPIRHVLEPLEEINLQNAVDVGLVVENAVKFKKTTDIEDMTMKQYREAILSNDSVELPLSGSHNPVKDVDQIGKKSGKRKADDGYENEKVIKRSVVKTKKAKLHKNVTF